MVKCGSFDSPTPISFRCDLDIFRRSEITFSLDNSGTPCTLIPRRCGGSALGKSSTTIAARPVFIGVLQRALEIHTANKKAATFECEPNGSHVRLTVGRNSGDPCKPLGLQISNFL